MYVGRKKDWESRPLGSEGRVFFGARSEQVTGAQPARAEFLSPFGSLTLRTDFEKS